MSFQAPAELASCAGRGPGYQFSGGEGQNRVQTLPGAVRGEDSLSRLGQPVFDIANEVPSLFLSASALRLKVKLVRCGSCRGSWRLGWTSQ